ncbi:pyridoxal phosphate-dependent aminotransferase [Mesobacterium pallidum]|uniref:pyridoxal phosphate-dependent aminotransferase n=1 Tax=Mesobacterium pallidum TaxID=2872037 RepID=UPI001EE22BDD|nr:aminotransferase class I/II-fold pyridoxal phosphate-dependent enzyme [Mesobacterium pallidum]
MQLSQRITGINEGASDGWGLFYMAREMVAAGKPVVELTIGEHDIGTAPEVIRAMSAAAHEGQTGYATVAGEVDLRAAIADRVQARTGVPTGPENVVVTPGGQGALFSAITAVADPGDDVLMVEPHYTTYPGSIRATAARPRAVRARAEDAFQPRAEDLAAAAPGARALLVNSPNNPTGAVYSRETVEGIAQVCRDHDLWLISDEVYDTQIWAGQHLSPRALPGMAERTLVVGSMSKSHAMTGSRVGWVIGPEEAVAALADLSVPMTYGIPAYIQEAALFALDQGEPFEDEVAAPFLRRRETAVALLAQQSAVRALPPDGAMYIMLDVRQTGVSGEVFAERLLREELIAVMPGSSFGPAATDHIRVAMTVADDVFAESFGRMLRFAARLKREAA